MSDLAGDKATILVRKWIPGEGRPSSPRANSASPSPSASEQRVRMSPRRSDDLDFILRHRGRKKKRADRIRRRRRAGVILGVFAVVVIVAVLSAGLGAGAALSQSCDLNTLRPVEIGQNSFVFARDGSLLGSIPAERNREPVRSSRMSRSGCRSATVVDRGPALLPARRRRLRGHRPRARGRT